MKPRSLFAVTVALASLALAPARALACATCGCGVEGAAQALGLASGLSTLRDGTLVQGGLDHQQRWSGVEPSPGRALASYEDRTVFLLAAQLFGRFGAQLQAPLVYRGASQVGTDATQRAGLGELELDLWATPLLVRAGYWEHRVALLAGLKAPTSVGTRMPSANDTMQRALMLGSGSWDGVAGALYAASAPRFALTLTALARLTTASPTGYRTGHSFATSVLPMYRPFEEAGFGLGLDWRYAGADEQDGNPLANTGGASLWLSPTVSLAPAPWLSVRVAVQLPVARWSAGTQAAGPTVLAGLTFTWERLAPPPPPRPVLARGYAHAPG